jgi:hypothetical protein
MFEQAVLLHVQIYIKLRFRAPQSNFQETQKRNFVSTID